MSSRSSSRYYAENCIDGNPYTTCSTGWDVNQWLSVELLATEPPQIVTGVEVYNRQNGYWDRLGSFEVWVGSSSGAWGEGSGALCVVATALTCTHEVGCSFVHACNTATGPHVGKFVTILLPGNNRLLQLGEVRVMV